MAQSGVRRRKGGHPIQKSANGLATDGAASTVEEKDHGTISGALVSASDLLMMVSLVFGGCCFNVWSFESLLRESSALGSTITFGQMLFITCQSLPSFLLRPKHSVLPRLKPRQVPVYEWCLQVIVLLGSTLLTNWSFAYTPYTLQIVFRSSGLPVSMLFGRVFLKKTYSKQQVLSVVLVTVGAVIATLSRPSSSSPSSSSLAGGSDQSRYMIGVAMLIISLLLTGTLGLLQEVTYQKYGPCWREGVFYTHLLSLPMFLFLVRDIREGIRVVVKASGSGTQGMYLVFALNMLTQLVCVSGVNQLASRVSSVSTNLVLTARKAASLCLSVWLFGSGWNLELVFGAGLVFLGTILYGVCTPRK